MSRLTDEQVARTLTFDEVAEVNAKRCDRWHEGMLPWSGADWSNAMQGEAGEAGNVVKKLRRLETQMRDYGNRPNEQDPAVLIEKLGNEIADTYLYLDLLARHYGVNIAECIIRKFNVTSDEHGFPERL